MTSQLNAPGTSAKDSAKGSHFVSNLFSSRGYRGAERLGRVDKFAVERICTKLINLFSDSLIEILQRIQTRSRSSTHHRCMW